MVSGDGAFGRESAHEVGAPVMGCVLYKRLERAGFFSWLSSFMRHSKNTAIWKPGKGPSLKPDHVGTLIADLLASCTVRNKFLLF